MRLLLSLQSDLRHPRCVVARVLVLLHCQAACRHPLQVHNQAELRRLRAMAQHLLHLYCKPLKVVLHAAPQQECVLQVLVPADLAVQARVVREALGVLAERRSHRHKCASSHSWAICSSADQST